MMAGHDSTRAFSGVTSAPLASRVSRTVPPMAGTRLSAISAAGTGLSDFCACMLISGEKTGRATP